jgi:hypothetical protein
VPGRLGHSGDRHLPGASAAAAAATARSRAGIVGQSLGGAAAGSGLAP